MTSKSIYSPGEFELRVGRSSAGLGLYAEQDIPKGVCVIEYTGNVLIGDDHNANNKYLFEVSAKKTIDGSPRWNTARYINHSCKPNCEPIIRKGKVLIMSKRKIKEGEELTYNYGKNYFDMLIGPHGCRCAACSADASKPKRATG